jgi:hypothetical protein
VDAFLALQDVAELADPHDDHAAILKSALAQWKPIFDQSAQGLYLYVDDDNAACNKVFASWLGYKTPKDWSAAGRGDFVSLVDPGSRKALVSAYRDAMANAAGSSVPVVWLTSDKKKVKTNVILVPFDLEGHRLALHFISKA